MTKSLYTMMFMTFVLAIAHEYAQASPTVRSTVAAERAVPLTIGAPTMEDKATVRNDSGYKCWECVEGHRKGRGQCCSHCYSCAHNYNISQDRRGFCWWAISNRIGC